MRDHSALDSHFAGAPVHFHVDDFGDERLASVLRGAATLGCRDIVSRVTSEILAFTAGAPQSDDITMVTLRRIA